MLTRKIRRELYTHILAEAEKLSEGTYLLTRYGIGVCLAVPEIINEVYGRDALRMYFRETRGKDMWDVIPEVSRYATVRSTSCWWFHNREERVEALKKAIELIDALDWWNGIEDVAERVEWKTRMAMRFYGFEANYATLTDEEIIRIYKLLRQDDGKTNQHI